MADEEKVELAAVPSNERDDESKKNKNDDPDVVHIDMSGDNNDGRKPITLPKIECDIDCKELCTSLCDRSNDLNIVSISIYLSFYIIYLFHFIVFLVFVGETAWFDADYCKTSLTKDECLDKSENGLLCDWTEWNNSNDIISDYCDSTYTFTFYQIILLFYFLIYLLCWEGLSMLSSIVTLVSFDRISKQPPSSNFNNFITPGGYPITQGGPASSNNNKQSDNNNNNSNNLNSSKNDNLVSEESGSNFGNSNDVEEQDDYGVFGGFETFGGNYGVYSTPGDSYNTPGGGNGGNGGGSGRRGRRRYCGVNTLPFRNRYIWSYNLFLPIKWSILVALSKCKTFDTFKYSLLASMALDKYNICLEMGVKVLFNCLWAIWWIILNNGEVDTITIMVFVTCGLLLLQNCYELGVLKAWDYKVYVLSSR